MPNKKGQQIATEQLIAGMVFVAILVVFLLFFISCGVSNIKESHEETKSSMDEIEVDKALTGFLEMPLDEEVALEIKNKVLDVLIESYIEDNYTEFDKMCREYFSPITNNWILSIHGTENRFHQVKGYSAWSFETTGEAFVELPVLKGSGDPERVVVVLAMGPYREI